MSRRLSHDQKRKKKLAQRQKLFRIEPYQGRKYEAEEYVEALSQAEMGIVEAFAMASRKLTDQQVARSLEYFVRELQGNKPSHLPEGNYVSVVDGKEEDLVVSQIKIRWDLLFSERPSHSNSDLAGILRKILQSVSVRTHGPHSQGYLMFMEKFLARVGFRVQEIPKEEISQYQFPPDPNACFSNPDVMRISIKD